MVQVHLVKNSIAAYLAAIEIHNKPNISYRYETTTLLMLNAWELALKALIKKKIKNRSIFTDDNKTITLNVSIDFVNQYKNKLKQKSFEAIKENLLELEKFRNNIVHYYCDELEPFIFMLLARAALNYVEFMRFEFSKDFMCDDGLMIMPLGFKLPFKPEDFLSRHAAKLSSESTNMFVKDIIQATERLRNNGVEDSIVLGFSIYFESVKKIENSDILAAITSPEFADIAFYKAGLNNGVEYSYEQIAHMNDEDFRKIWKYNHKELVAKCIERIPNFSQGSLFTNIKKSLSSDINLVYDRKLDSKVAKSASKKFYTEKALEFLEREFKNS